MGLTFTGSYIQSNFCAKPDVSINFEKAKKQFDKYPERWDTAFKFLIVSNLETLPIGRIDLSSDVYVTVSEYETLDFENTEYESHKKYIDLQYLVTGKERIGWANKEDLPVNTAYSEEKDIIFYNYDGGIYLTATPSTYFLFFPRDCHRPCLEAGGKSKVRKIVVKIKYN